MSNRKNIFQKRKYSADVDRIFKVLNIETEEKRRSTQGLEKNLETPQDLDFKNEKKKWQIVLTSNTNPRLNRSKNS